MEFYYNLFTLYSYKQQINLYMTNSKVRNSESAHSIYFVNFIKIVYFLHKHNEYKNIQHFREYKFGFNIPVKHTLATNKQTNKQSTIVI